MGNIPKKLIEIKNYSKTKSRPVAIRSESGGPCVGEGVIFGLYDLPLHARIGYPWNMIPTGSSSVDPVPPARSTPGSSEVARLQGQVERLLMTTEALWNILKEKQGLDDKELLRQIVQIDLRDGKLDGHVAPTPPEPCPKCQRVVAKQSVRCMYCGEPLLMNPFAR